jgi:hypothetical protein
MLGMKPFLIFALPRSMTAWTSCFLNYGDVICQHEMFQSMETTLEKVVESIQIQPAKYSGICDPSALIFGRWRKLVELLPSAPVVYIRRPVQECLESFAKVAQVSSGMWEKAMGAMAKEAEMMILKCEPLIIDWQELRTPTGCCKLWDYVAPSALLKDTHVKRMLSLHIEQRPELIQSVCKNFGMTTKA